MEINADGKRNIYRFIRYSFELNVMRTNRNPHFQLD